MSDSPTNCPRCGRPRVFRPGVEGNRVTFQCGTYLYRSLPDAIHTTDLCETVEELRRLRTAMKPRVEWTKTPPTEPGLYWNCGEGGSGLELLEVELLDGRLSIYVGAHLGYTAPDAAYYQETFWWSEPVIKPPTPPVKP